LSFSLIISCWWQYFDNLEKKIDKSVKTTGQIILYGHLFIYISLYMIAASIQLLFIKEVNYYFMLNFIFCATFFYFLSTTVVFHKYRYENEKLFTTTLLFLFYNFYPYSSNCFSISIIKKCDVPTALIEIFSSIISIPSRTFNSTSFITEVPSI
jgi:low temperature requirement protein LtrA